MEIAFKNFKITDDIIEKELSESVKRHLERVGEEVRHPKRKTISTLQKLIEKYPDTPQFRNFLSSVYMQLGEEEKAWQANDELLEKFPDYLFGNTNKAIQYLNEEKYDEVLDLFHKNFDLENFYPDRDLFHKSEFMALQKIAVLYYAKTRNLEQAEKRLRQMQEVDPESALYQQAEQALEEIRIETIQERLGKEEHRRITPESTFIFDKDIRLPELQLPETAQLYEEGILSEEVIDKILRLDREKLISDLETILKKSCYKHHDLEPDPEAVHALFLLGELEAEESLPVVLKMMCQDEGYFEDVFGMIFTDFGWIPLLKMGKNRLDLLEEYLKLPGLYTFFRSTALDALIQVHYHYPNQRSKVIAVCEDLLHFFLQDDLEANIIDTEFVSLLIWDIVDLEQTQLLPQIKALYEKGYVAESVCGSFEEVARDIKKTDVEDYKKREIQSIKEIYQDLSEPYPMDFEEEDSFPLEDEFYDDLGNTGETYTREYKKIGRNDSCPCGSGKKFKKCCLGKGIYD